MRIKRFRLWVSILIFLIFILIAYLTGVKEYILDSVLFIILVILLNVYYKKFNLDRISYVLLVVGMVLHNSGVFGWYGNSPFIFQYDHITHFVGFVGIGSFVSGYLFRNFRNWFERLVIILLVCAGIGAFIEIIEFIGYLKLGEGAGFFYFGGLGDTGVDLRAMDAMGGGWLNTMWDLVYNFVGSIVGYVIYLVRNS